MRQNFLPYWFAVLMTCGIASAGPALAEDAVSKTSAAVSNIIFTYDADEFSSYRIREDGFLEFTFARNTPEALYSEILNKLQNSPDIKGVLPGRDGPTCPRF